MQTFHPCSVINGGRVRYLPETANAQDGFRIHSQPRQKRDVNLSHTFYQTINFGRIFGWMEMCRKATSAVVREEKALWPDGLITVGHGFPVLRSACL